MRWFRPLLFAITIPAALAAEDQLAADVEAVRRLAAQFEPAENIDWSLSRLEPDQPLAPPGYEVDLPRPRLQKLFSTLNLDYPGLESVKAHVEAGDWDAAGVALAEYYRARHWPSVLLTFDEPLNDPAFILVELAMRDIFTQALQFARQPRREDGRLDWRHRGPRNNPEWAWWINRMGHLPYAVMVWEATGDPRYVQLVNDHLADWIQANPYPGRRTFSAPWRPLEVARRIDRSWLDALIGMRHAKDLSVETRLLTFSSIPDHADALLNFPSFGGNHLLTEKVMLGQLATAFPEFKDADRWLEDAVNTVVGLLDKQIYPDGAYEELANHYQLVALGSFQRFLELLETAGDQSHLAEVKPTVERMWNYFAYVMRPSGYGPLNNDSDRTHNRAELQRALAWFDHPDWTFLSSGGKQGVEPASPPSRFFPWAGHAIMRSSWRNDAQWAFFDLGPYGSDHQHLDRLHLSVSFGGKDFLVDSGRYDYMPGPWRDYFKGPYGHNTILLDGQWPERAPEKVSAPMPVLAQINERADQFAGSVRFPAQPASGKGPRTHRRQVSYARGGGWVVFDEIIAFGPTKVTARWLFHPDRQVEIDGGAALRTVDAEGPNLRLEPFGPEADWKVSLHRGEKEPAIAGWFSPEFLIREPATQAIFETTITQPTTFIWAIGPNDLPGKQLIQLADAQDP